MHPFVCFMYTKSGWNDEIFYSNIEWNIWNRKSQPLAFNSKQIIENTHKCACFMLDVCSPYVYFCICSMFSLMYKSLIIFAFYVFITSIQPHNNMFSNQNAFYIWCIHFVTPCFWIWIFSVYTSTSTFKYRNENSWEKISRARDVYIHAVLDNLNISLSNDFISFCSNWYLSNE